MWWIVTRLVVWVTHNNRELGRPWNWGSRCGVIRVAREQFTQLPGSGPSEPVKIVAFARDTLGDMTGPAMGKGRLGIYRR